MADDEYSKILAFSQQFQIGYDAKNDKIMIGFRQNGAIVGSEAIETAKFLEAMGADFRKRCRKHEPKHPGRPKNK